MLKRVLLTWIFRVITYNVSEQPVLLCIVQLSLRTSPVGCYQRLPALIYKFLSGLISLPPKQHGQNRRCPRKQTAYTQDDKTWAAWAAWAAAAAATEENQFYATFDLKKRACKHILSFLITPAHFVPLAVLCPAGRFSVFPEPTCVLSS